MTTYKAYPVAEPAALARPLYSCLSLNMGDRLRLIHFPQEAVQWIETAIVESGWPGGVQSTKVYSGCSFEFKLRGYPWNGQGSGDAVASRRLMLYILRALKTNGFFLVTSTDMSRSEWDKDTLMFKRGVPPPRRPNMFSISLNESDKIRVIDASPALYAIVSDCITKYWPQGLQREKPLSRRCKEYKLHGYPWDGQSSDSVYARLFVMNLLSTLDAHGWRMYGSVDMSTGKFDKDSWFFEEVTQESPAY